MTDDFKFDLFVYGTLRTGEPLHGWLEPHILNKRDAIINGLLFEFGNGSFPVALLGRTGMIRGEVFTLYMCNEVSECINMEVSAGYEPRVVKTYHLDGTQAEDAVAFHFGYPHLLGERIPSGDWFDYIREQGR